MVCILISPGGGGWVLRVESERVMLCSDRKRVVAVFAHGAKWQFQGYPWPTPAQIFDNSKPATHPIASGLLFPSATCCDSNVHRVFLVVVCAYHLHFDDEPLNPNIKEWKIIKLKVCSSLIARLQSVWLITFRVSPLVILSPCRSARTSATKIAVR